MDAPAHIVSGLTDSAKALVVAAAAQAQPATVHLYIVPSDADLEQACADASFFPRDRFCLTIRCLDGKRGVHDL